MSDELVPNYVERPDCGHMQTIMARPHHNVADYNSRLVPELQAAIKEPCSECEKAKAELARQKRIQEMEDKAKTK